MLAPRVPFRAGLIKVLDKSDYPSRTGTLITFPRRPFGHNGPTPSTDSGLDGEDIAAAASALGISLAAAYKRRQRTENRIAHALHITARRRASGRSKTVSRARDQGRNATADEA